MKTLVAWGFFNQLRPRRVKAAPGGGVKALSPLVATTCCGVGEGKGLGEGPWPVAWRRRKGLSGAPYVLRDVL